MPHRILRPSSVGRLALIVAVGWGWSRAEAGEATDRALADFDPTRPIRYSAQVEPILSLLGCNSGSCHGKMGGQHGFALSLFGSDPKGDLAAVAGRVDRDDPLASLLIQKPTQQVPHGGGLRLAVGSVEYETLIRWIGESDPNSRFENEPKLVRVAVNPPRQILAHDSRGQVRVEAAWDDGSVVDVTRLARFESNLPALVEVQPDGGLVVGSRVGEASIMIRYGGDLAVGRVVVPSGRERILPLSIAGSEVDRMVGRKLGELGLEAGPLAADREYARRSALDLTGQLPDPRAVEVYENDRRPDKRARWVDSLLARPVYADYFAMKWSAILRNRRSLGDLSKPTTFGFHGWIREAIAENLPYDQFVAAIVGARGDAASSPNVGWYRQVASTEERTADVAQVFLGTRIGCARCHHHPTERWGQGDYGDFAAFFARIGTKAGADPNSFRVFDTKSQSRPPRPLGVMSGFSIEGRDDPRDALMAWMVGPENPFFARAVANRYWKHFLGRGLVEPEDDLRATNPATDPDLLDSLATGLREHQFDLRWLIRAITTSDTYARSSLPDPADLASGREYTRFAPKALAAEVLLDAIDTVAGTTSRFEGVPPATRATQLPDDGFASPFLDAFGRPSRRTACECERTTEPTLSQALFLLNSAEIEARLSAREGRAARYAGAEDRRPDSEKLDELYQVALARPPSDLESSRAIRFLDERRAAGQLAVGFEDVIWALINTKEFFYNH